MCCIVYNTLIDMSSFDFYCSPMKKAGILHPNFNIRNLRYTKVSDLPKVTILRQ